MALVVKDRVKETTATTGTGTLTLAGAVSGFQTFASALSNADTTYYAIREDSTGEWEVGLGTFTASGTLLSRDTILESSNAGSVINLTVGSAEVFITYPAEKSVYLDASGDVTSAAGQIDISNFNNDSGYSTTTGTVTSVAASAGTGISVSGSPITTSGTLTITNTAPDQTVVLTEGSNVTITGTYPNFTIASTDTNTTYSAGTALDLSGTTFNVDLSELSTSTSDGDGDYFVVVDTSNAQRKLTKGNINISGFNNDAGYTTNVGDITGVTAGTGLSGGGSSGSVTLAVDLSELTDMTATMVGTDEFIVLDAGADRRKAANEIGLSIFNNDAGFTTNVGDITGVTAGNGLTGGGASGSVTLNVGAGGGITVAADTVSHSDTSSQSSVNNSNGTVIQDVTLDTYGHVTALGSVDLDGRYYTESEIDSTFAPLANPNFTGAVDVGSRLTIGSTERVTANGLEISGPTSSMIMTVQDGSGRIQWRWNASSGVTPTYLVSGEQSARYEILDVTQPGDALWRIDHAAAGTAGATISYTNILSLGTTTFTYNSNTVWHAGNDGSGSGLDADLLDGVQGSSYLRSDANDSFSGTITNSGVFESYYDDNSPGSNLKLGRSSSQYMTFHGGSSGNYMTSISSAGNPKNNIAFGISTDSGATLDSTYSLSGNSGTIWHTGNDGPGSGLDADTLDGVQGANYLRSDTSDTFNGTLTVTTGIALDNGSSDGAGVEFKSAGNTSWEIDNSGGALRFFQPGTTYVTVTTSSTTLNGIGIAESFQEDYDALSGTTPAPDADNAGAFSLTTSGNTTFTFGSVTSGRSVGFILELTAGGTHTITWPASVDWAGGTAPDAPASGETDIYVFWTRNGGTTWYGIQSVDAAA